MSQNYQDPFVTVVSVGTDTKSQRIVDGGSEFVTVLTIGNEESKTIKDVTEEVIVYRLPGERLGFGLKFEGGTKAHEFVKRLFIQSCAPDSPASRVQSSWGQLVEGDEVLKIDSVPVNSMTRIDCVRLLKESNVAIKLLVKHSFSTKMSEYLPVIVSEEKKPPPVPPRKIHRKLHKNHEINDIVPTIKQQDSLVCKGARLQSPRNSGRRKYSPDFCRRLSECNPPDAEVYLDLFSQESTQSLSESDDTGSTISTVLDRFASTTSSFAGSLPSTPTSIQKQLDLSYIVNEFDEDEYNIPNLDKKIALIEENNNIVDGADHCRHSGNEIDDLCGEKSPETSKRPIKTPRSRDKLDRHIVVENKSTLPRLVDFVPKSSNKSEMENSVDTLKRFLECERFDFDYSMSECVEDEDLDFISNGMDLFGTKWGMSSHLSTIGEDEEEGGQDLSSNFGEIVPAPKVTVESSEVDSREDKSLESEDQPNIEIPDSKYKKDLMEVLPSDSRQPPDGHEFPDFIETSNSFQEKPVESTRGFNFSWNDLSQIKPVPLDRTISSSNYDLRQNMSESEEEKFETPKTSLLHTRSQSLIDMSIFSKEKHSKWSTLAEQRKRRLSKLKGLVIPEASENEVTPCDIPEIKNPGPTIILSSKSDVSVDSSSKPIIRDVPLVLPSWSTTTVPKYSPAFKRKSLQVYPAPVRKISSESIYENYLNTKFLDNNGSRTNNEDPKSLESIASPTRSDCSFDYASSRQTDKLKAQDATKHDDESDNDSAVSSSQSSYNSRCSPPLSPTSDDTLNSQNRLLKPFSVEAVNRKNILASAKCSSGKDLKIGSPVIQRKYEEEEKQVKEDVEVVKLYQLEQATPVLLKTANAIPVNGDVEQTAIITEASKGVPEPALRNITAPSTKEKFENINEIRKSVLSRYSSSNNKPVNVKSLKENFENPSANSMPVFPHNFKTDIRTRPIRTISKDIETKPLVTVAKPVPARRQTQSKEVLGKKSEESPIEIVGKEISCHRTLHLNRDSVESNLGIILAVGDECQFKIVHRIRYGSVAYQDGTLKKGDKIVSINGRSTASLSHDAATELLKEPCAKFTIVYEELKEMVPSNISRRSSSSVTSLSTETKVHDVDANIVTKNATHTVGLIKDGAGLGFSIEGGKDSPKGDVPLLVKKIFTGGAADKCGELQVGDEIISVNEVSCINMSRMEAWTLMKKMPEGAVKIQIYR